MIQQTSQRIAQTDDVKRKRQEEVEPVVTKKMKRTEIENDGDTEQSLTSRDLLQIKKVVREESIASIEKKVDKFLNQKADEIHELKKQLKLKEQQRVAEIEKLKSQFNEYIKNMQRQRRESDALQEQQHTSEIDELKRKFKEDIQDALQKQHTSEIDGLKRQFKEDSQDMERQRNESDARVCALESEVLQLKTENNKTKETLESSMMKMFAGAQKLVMDEMLPVLRQRQL
jgi:hypothetical protein